MNIIDYLKEKSQLLSALYTVLDEESTELDLHYEDEDAAGLIETLERIKPAADLLVANGCDLPASYKHILLRFKQPLGSQH